jgi:hypothetical protein
VSISRCRDTPYHVYNSSSSYKINKTGLFHILLDCIIKLFLIYKRQTGKKNKNIFTSIKWGKLVRKQILTYIQYVQNASIQTNQIVN